MAKFKIGEEVNYSGFKEIYIITALKDNENNTEEIKELLKKWDCLITQKGEVGFIQVKEDLIKKIT